ncbi:DUF4124 domain-containing protein [Dokdonella sp. MW10]|uniref:DUF4124 domain-containing protein n=1 Tax=Dokdonella sp. MW10 TaxID=2992926 RepID=UPI003F7D03F2
MPPLCWILFVACTMSFAPGLSAQVVYRCTGEDGSTVFQDRACTHGTRLVMPAEPAPSHATAPRERTTTTSRGKRPAASTPRNAPARAVTSNAWECRASGGAVFYRFSTCPATLPAKGTKGTRAHGTKPPERVQARAITLPEACRRMRANGREGREHDDRISTYDRNLGRDPCRRH